MKVINLFRTWLTVPRLIQLSFVAVALGTLVLFAVARSAYHQHENAADTIGRRATRGIEAAQQLKVDLSALNALAGERLITGRSEDLDDRISEKRKQVSSGVRTVAENIHFGTAETVPIDWINYVLPQYLRLIAEAIELRDAGNTVQSSEKFLSADELMQKNLLPYADQLDEANRTALNASYNAALSSDARAEHVVWVAAVFLVLVLALAQLYVRRKFRRVVDLPLLLALLIVVAGTAYLQIHLSHSAEKLHTAKEDSFEKVHQLWRTEAHAYALQSTAQAALISGRSNDELFSRQLNKLISMPGGLSFESLSQSVLDDQVNAECAGYLPRLLKNPLSTGERQAIARATLNLAQFVKANERASAALKSGQPSEALRRWTAADNQSARQSFTRLSDELKAAKKVSQSEFDGDIDAAFRSLESFGFAIPAAALLTVALALIGLWLRLREYTR